jgi:hypothetical protein
MPGVGHKSLVTGIVQKFPENFTVDGKVEGEFRRFGTDALGCPQEHGFAQNLVE